MVYGKSNRLSESARLFLFAARWRGAALFFIFLAKGRKENHKNAKGKYRHKAIYQGGGP